MFGLLFCLTVYGFTDFESLFNDATPAGIYKVTYAEGKYTLGTKVAIADIETVFTPIFGSYCTEAAGKCEPNPYDDVVKGVQTEASNACDADKAETEYAASFLFDYYGRKKSFFTNAADILSIPYIACNVPAFKGTDPMAGTGDATGNNCAKDATAPSHILPVLTSIIAHPPWLSSCVPKAATQPAECPTKCAGGANEDPKPLFNNFQYRPVVVGVTQGTIADLKKIISKFGPVIAQVKVSLTNLKFSEADKVTKFALDSGVVCPGADVKPYWMEVVGYTTATIPATTKTQGSNANAGLCDAAETATNEIAAKSAWVIRNPYADMKPVTTGTAGLFYMFETETAVVPTVAASNDAPAKFDAPFADTKIEYYFIAYDNIGFPSGDGKEAIATLSADKFVGTAAVPTTLKKYTTLTDEQAKEPFRVLDAETVGKIKETANVFTGAPAEEDYSAMKAGLDALLYTAYRESPIDIVASLTGSLSMLPESSTGQGEYLKRDDATTFTKKNLLELSGYVMPMSGLVDVACVEEKATFTPVTNGKCTATGKTTEDITTVAGKHTMLWTQKPTLLQLKKNIALYGPAVTGFACDLEGWKAYAEGEVTATTIFKPATGGQDKMVYCTILGWDKITPTASNVDPVECWIVKFIENVGKAATANAQTTIGNVEIVPDVTDKFQMAMHFVIDEAGPTPDPDAAFSMSIPSKIILALVSLFVMLF